RGFPSEEAPVDRFEAILPLRFLSWCVFHFAAGKPDGGNRRHSLALWSLRSKSILSGNTMVSFRVEPEWRKKSEAHQHTTRGLQVAGSDLGPAWWRRFYSLSPTGRAAARIPRGRQEALSLRSLSPLWSSSTAGRRQKKNHGL